MAKRLDTEGKPPETKRIKRTLPQIHEPEEDEAVEVSEAKPPKKSVEPFVMPTMPPGWEIPTPEELQDASIIPLPANPADFKKTSLRYERPLYQAAEEIHYMLRLQSGEDAPAIQDIVNTALEVFLKIYRTGGKTPLAAWMLRRMYERRQRSRNSQSRKMRGPRNLPPS
jgi:hypothetical protein